MELNAKYHGIKKEFKENILYAIVGEFVLINQIWVEDKKGYKEYIVEKLDEQSIVLKNKNKSVILKLYGNE